MPLETGVAVEAEIDHERGPIKRQTPESVRPEQPQHTTHRRCALVALIQSLSAPSRRSSPDWVELGKAWQEIGILDMELGDTGDALEAGQRALVFHRRGGSLFGAAEAHQLLAHVLSQRGDIYSALREANESSSLLERALSNEVPRGLWDLKRAAYEGTIGQMLTRRASASRSWKLTQAADAKLRHAHEVNVESGRGASWGATYAARLTLNFIEAARIAGQDRERIASLSRGEASLSWARTNGQQLTIPMQALLLRAEIAFAIAAHRWSEADARLAGAFSFAKSYGLGRLAGQLRSFGHVIRERGGQRLDGHAG